MTGEAKECASLLADLASRRAIVVVIRTED
jgi:hypothetical protein